MTIADDTTSDATASGAFKDTLAKAREALAVGDWEVATDLGRELSNDGANAEIASAFWNKLRVHRCSEARRRLNAKDPEVFAEIDRIHELFPEDVVARRLAARAMIERRDYEGAKSFLAELVREADVSADDFVQYARACRSTRDVEAAIGACFDALLVQAEAPAALALLDRLLPRE